MSMTSILPRVTVIGVGYLGLTHAVCMADLGHEVLAIDVDRQKIAKAASGEVPFFEPGLEPLLRKNVDAGRLRFTTSFAEIGGFGEVHFLCVGTPQAVGGAADLSYVHAAADALASCTSIHRAWSSGSPRCRSAPRGRCWPGSATAAPAGNDVDLAWNPEFLREGYAVQDSLTPDRLVFGVHVRGRRGAAAPRSTPSRSRRILRRWSPIWRRQSWSRWPPTRSWPPRSLSSTRWRRCARRRAPTSPSWLRRSATTSGSAGSSSVPASASAVAACPRTSAPSARPRRNSACIRSSACSVTSTAST